MLNLKLMFYSGVAIYLMYAKHEEEHGLPRAAMDIYKRATKAIRPDEAHEACAHLLPIFCIMIFSENTSVLL